MGYRIAVASSDGIVVNQHFGRASRFLIMDVDAIGNTSPAGERSVVPLCDGGIHDENRMQETIVKLSDCQYILVSRIGQGAEAALEQKGIKVFEIPGIIGESVKKLTAYVELQELMS
jgi:predicted Fe-Mo cluster-binding NifX family protein